MAAKSIQPIIKKFKLALKKAGFPDARFYLFGSQVRGDARPDSDIDICLVSPLFRRNKDKYEIEAVIIAYGIDPRIQVVLASPEKFDKDPLSPLFSHIRKYAKAA